MAEVGVSVAAKLAEYLVDPTLRQLQYLFCVRKITRNVEIRKEELMQKQGSVQERVQEAMNRTERIDDEVNKWKNDVQSLIEEVENSEERLRANNGCLRGWCPTWRRYRLCKSLEKTTQRMIDLITKSDHLDPFSHPVIAPDVESHNSQNFTLFKSTQMAFNQLLHALRDDGGFMIGLRGMGGSGKTTLVKEVGKKAKESQLFDRVVFATVSQSRGIRDIQGEIADKLGIELKEESETGRANRIALRLQSGERILIILDDVWAKKNLEEIGIPFVGNHPRSCKVVLTTRRLKVCTLMECQKTIQLDLLKEDEAWTLFQTHANVDDAAKEVVARAIARECKGLPIAIVALGTCLKGRDVDEMSAMLDSLENAKLYNVVDEEVKYAFTCLELSYEYLANTQAKRLLLMCAMFPEDHNINVEDLFRYGVGLGLYGDVDCFDTMRRQFKTFIKYLIDSSLLMCSSSTLFGIDDGQEYVKLHDMVRDVALWIASREDHTILVNCNKELNGLIAEEVVKDCYAVSSWYDNDDLVRFPSQLDAPKLEFLLLSSRQPLDMSHASFEGTKRLKALIMDTSSFWIKLQPQPIQHLSNLRTLRLQHWDLHDISFVVSLTRLEILDLRRSKFERVPNGISKLNKLKLLDLSGCTMEECCYKVVGQCSQLEELYVSTLHSHPGKENCYECLVGPTALLKLTRYNLKIGKPYYGTINFQKESNTRYLRMGQLHISMIGAIIKDLAQRAAAIELYQFEGGNNISMTNVVQAVGGMNELTKLRLERCSKIECFMDETTHEDVVVPRLDELVLSDMDNLKEICRGPPFRLFQKLERLNVWKCPQLLHIFPAGCNLGNLKFLKINRCPMLTSLFAISAACTLFSLKELHIKRCSKLTHVLEGECGGDAWENLKFPELKRLSVVECREFEYVCPVFLAQRFVQLQSLSIKGNPQMKFVFGENVGREQAMHDQDESQLVLPLLEELDLYILPNLVGICPERYHTMWPSIKTLECKDCPNTEAIFTCKEESQKIAESCLPKLKSLKISECNKLEFILSISTAASMLPQLSTMIISNCSQMEEIFKCSNMEDHDIDSEGEITFPNMKDMELNKLPRLVNICQGFKLHTDKFYRVKVDNCPKFIPIKSASIDWKNEKLVREYELKFSQLSNDEVLNLPLSVLIAGELDIQSPRVVEHNWRVIGDERRDQEETSNSRMSRAEQQMPGGLVPTQVLFFQYLYSLKVTHNKKLKRLFSVSTIVQNSLPKLTSLTLSDCEELEEIIAENEERQMVSNIQFGLPKLRELKVERCNKLKSLFSTSTTVILPQLLSLKISEADILEVIFGNNSEGDANYNETIVLSSLWKIDLINLPNLMSVCQGFQIQVVKLSCIDIHNCPKFSDSSLGSALQQSGTKLELQELKGHQVRNEEYKSSTLVKIIKFDNCGVESFFHYQTGVEEQIATFQYLEALTLKKCARLKFVFSTHLCQSLPMLTSMKISYCDELEAVFSRNEETQKDLSINESCLQKLKTLEISECNRLKFILSFNANNSDTSMLPKLSTLTISDCSQMEEIFKCTNIEDHDIESEREITLPNMKVMELNNLPRLVNVCQGFKLHTEKLRRVSIRDCQQLMPVMSAYIYLTKESLVREYELKYSQLNNNEALKIPIPVLNVGELDIQSASVEHKWRVIGDDEQEESNDSEILGGLVPSQVWSFQYLHSLKVTKIKKLKFVFPKSTIVQNSLPKLTSLTLSDCEELEVIFVHSSEDDANCGETIVFPSLRWIELTDLPNFKSICQQGLQMQVQLNRISISNCPKFVDSSLGSVFQQLGTLRLPQLPTEDSNVETSSANVNEQKGMMMISGAAEQLHVWEGPTFIIFQNLNSLNVSKCRKIKCMFPSNVIRSIPCLEYLSIEECEELEEIMSSSGEEHHFPNESSHSSLCFPQLRTLKVKGCSKLIWLFPSQTSTQLHLPLLLKLTIEDCSQLEGLFNSEIKILEEAFSNNLLPNESSNNSLCFPQLKTLKVIRCTNLKCLFPSLPSAQHRLPKLERLTIKECPQLKRFCNCEVEIHDEGAFYYNLLPNLTHFTLEDCPIFFQTTLVVIQSWQQHNKRIFDYRIWDEFLE